MNIDNTAKYFASMIQINHLFKLKSIGLREISQWLRALASLVEDPGSIPRTHMWAHNHL